MRIKTIGVIGAGTMGNGIAHVSALTGFDTILMDIKDEFVERGLNTIRTNLERQVKKEKISQSDMDGALKLIRTTTVNTDLSDCDLVVEAATENQDIKLNIFKEMDQICKKEAILASNTSSISITKIASATYRQNKVIGMHFMNPVPVMKLVEVVRGKKTDDNTVDKIKELSENMGKIPVVCNDSPGFISNRILMPMINEAAFVYMEGVAKVEAIDEIMKDGPFTRRVIKPIANPKTVAIMPAKTAV